LVVVPRPLVQKQLLFKIIQECRGVWCCNEDEVARAMHGSIEASPVPQR